MEKEKSPTQAQKEEIEDVFEYIQGLHFEDIKKRFFEEYPNAEDSIQWVVDHYNVGGALDYYELSNVDAQKCDAYIVYCSSCQRAWEKPHNKEEQENHVLYYIDFPTYNRENELCPMCQDSLERLIKES